MLYFKNTDGGNKSEKKNLHIFPFQGKILDHGYVMLKAIDQLTFFLTKNFYIIFNIKGTGYRFLFIF